MKLLPCARKISATSTVGRVILLFSFAGSASNPAPKWEERRWGYSRLASDVGISADRWSSIPDRRDRAEPGSPSDRSHVPTGESPNCDAECAETPFSVDLIQ